MLKLYSIISIFFISSFTFSQGTNTSCINAVPICANGVSFQCDTNNITPATGNNYDCVSIQSNPTWYYFEIAQAGGINMSLQASNDLDFVIWGPFADTTAAFSACGNLGNSPNPSGTVDCGFVGGNIEYPDITAAAVSDIYVMMISNYSAVSVTATLTQIGGSGSLVCPPQAFYGTHLKTGSTYYDMNQNGLKDIGEQNLPNVAISISPLSNQFFTNGIGNFNINTNASSATTYTASASLSNWTQTNATPDYTFLLDSLNYTKDSLDFGFYPDSLYYNASINPVDIANHCITNNIGWFNIINNGTNPINTQASITLDPNLVFVSASISPDSIVNQKIFFSIDSVGVYDNISIQFTTNLNASLTLGDSVTNSYQLSIFDYNNNLEKTYHDTLINEVICSYDPNDKTSFINNNSSQETISINDYIDFTIRFQNTGNAAAINIEIIDTIDFDLNLSTFQILSSSHTTAVTIDNNREVSFVLNDINLPDHISDEPGSHGYITYRIYQNLDLDPNTEINNTAYIYFDNNSAIVTNTTVNKVACYIIPDSSLNQNNNILSVPNSTNHTYQWYLDNSLLANETNPQIQINGDGIYSVEIINQYGCVSTADFNFECSSTIDSIIPVTFNSGVLSVVDSANYSYQWYLDGVMLPTETDHQIHIVTEGVYSVLINNVFGCQAEGSYTIDFTSINNYQGSTIFTYPNPTTNLLNIELSVENTLISTILIRNLAGQILLNIDGSYTNKMSIDLSSIANGAYILEVTNNQGKILSKKLIKI